MSTTSSCFATILLRRMKQPAVTSVSELDTPLLRGCFTLFSPLMISVSDRDHPPNHLHLLNLPHPESHALPKAAAMTATSTVGDSALTMSPQMRRTLVWRLRSRR